MIDADNHTVQERYNQLNQALADAQYSAVLENERIARLIPKQNVETWILCLNGQPVNEETNYQRDKG